MLIIPFKMFVLGFKVDINTGSDMMSFRHMPIRHSRFAIVSSPYAPVRHTTSVRACARRVVNQLWRMGIWRTGSYGKSTMANQHMAKRDMAKHRIPLAVYEFFSPAVFAPTSSRIPK